MEDCYHVPVLLNQAVEGLKVRQGGTYIDLTFGGGGHSIEILKRMEGQGKLYAFDQDADAYDNFIHNQGLFEKYNKNFQFVRGNFKYVKNFMLYYGQENVDGVLADLGVSSHHFDDPNRGFSFRFDAPLDMRMNQGGGRTAEDIINTYDEKSIAQFLFLYGELKNSRRMAEAIVKARKTRSVKTVGDLIEVLTPFFPKQRLKKEMAKAFQAIRIEVNQEMEALKEMLQAMQDVVAEGGRLVVITYHSLEDRLVKNLIRTGNCEGVEHKDFFGSLQQTFEMVNKKVITPTQEEIDANPRARSAKLRIAVRTAQKKETM